MTKDRIYRVCFLSNKKMTYKKGAFIKATNYYFIFDTFRVLIDKVIDIKEY